MAKDIKKREQSYKDLQAHYHQMFEMIDGFHFNSSVSYDVYARYLNLSCSEIIPISHSGIKDNRVLKTFSSTYLQIGFIGSSTVAYKGFPLLKRVLLSLFEKGQKNWHLSVYGGRKGMDEDCPNIEYTGKFSSVELPAIYSKMDLLVVPSICYETFSLVTLEALSYGVPVLASSTVGAKDIIMQYDPSFVFIAEQDLRQKMEELVSDRRQLKNYNKRINELAWKHDLSEHSREIESFYNQLLDQGTKSL